ncbi:uncharacterized protein JCM15063_001672 [Sporobolomyces koalae]|uniref:uncharacterized protein n=1 Tax=Sporobolomyces koalae TaxID=500713 RepID=UPI0031727E38
MALTRTTLLVCSSLTLHFALFSLVLHYSQLQDRTNPYYPSSAIVVTEAGKVLLSILLVARSGELSEYVQQRKRAARAQQLWTLEQDERRLLGRDTEVDPEHEKARTIEHEATQGGRDQVNDNTSGKQESRRASSGNLHIPRNPGLSINVERARSFVPGTPSLSVIPPTPAPEPSPTRIPEASLLFPDRPLREFDTPQTAYEQLRDRVWWQVIRDCVVGRSIIPVAIISLCYIVQAQLQYSASANLSVPIFQLAYQLKIPATAMFSVILLNRTISAAQWISLFILTIGVGIVQVASVSTDGSGSDVHAGGNRVWGISAVLLACMTSGFASSFFERLLKVQATSTDPLAQSSTLTLPTSAQPETPAKVATIVPTKPSLWIRNIQLGSLGLVVGIPFVVYDQRSNLARIFLGIEDEVATYLGETWSTRMLEAIGNLIRGFFQGFSQPVVWFLIFLQVTGGLLSALVIQYADNVLKCFATSLSILFSTAASVFLFDFSFTPGIALGAVLVMGSTLAYTAPGAFRALLSIPLSVWTGYRRP